MTSKNILHIAAVVIGLTPAAVTAQSAGETIENLRVTLNDGSVVRHNLANINEISFESSQRDFALLVRPANGDESVYESIPTLFRCDNKDIASFGLGNAKAASPADLRNGAYGIRINIPTSLFNTTATLEQIGTGAIELYNYDGGAMVSRSKDFAEATVTTITDGNNMSLLLKALMTNGTEVIADYTGDVTTATSLAEMALTAMEIPNKISWFNADSDLFDESEILSVSYSEITSGMFRGYHSFTFTLSKPANGTSYYQVYFKTDVAGQRHDVTEVANNTFLFSYGNNWLSGPNSSYSVCQEGSFLINCNPNDPLAPIIIDLDLRNKFISPYDDTQSLKGDGSRLRLHYITQ